jgi:hypothetical protein
LANLNIVRLKPLTEATQRQAAATERIALALETLLRVAYGIDLAPQPPAKDDSGAEVSYASDEDTLAKLLEEELIRTGIRPQKEDNE